ncbi:MAG: helix-turn-helix domain-containing protein [Bacteroidales bacterium]|nr:helix-turn-helix transcriptional regulator [Anaerotignum sp.]MCI5679637.1 helix-turn-helix domain-containing protein [Bacteroidales bacterium]MDY3926606.1 helix-turn-helix transcriptional regulator [Anaerotignum sp.]
MDMIKTGELLSRLRKEHGMTQKQVAEVLQISDRTVSKWERGVSQS